MELIIDNEISEVLKKHHIYQSRTGMKRKFEEPKTRWKNGDVLNFEKNTVIEEFTTFAAGNNLFTCGAFSSTASNLGSKVEIGRYTEIATGCRRMGYRHPIEAVSTNSAFFNFCRENVYSYFEEYENKNGNVDKISVPTPQPQRNTIKIGNDVWIGNDVVITGDIVIGDGAVICSNAVVTKDVPAYSVVGGVPAKVIKYRFSDKICEELLASKWYTYELGDMYYNEFNFSSPEAFLDKFYTFKDQLRKYEPNVFSPYKYLVQKMNGANVDINNMLITHHNTVLAINLSTFKIEHMLLNQMTDTHSPIKVNYKGDKLILSINSHQYIKRIDTDKVVLSSEECYLDSEYTLKDNIVSFSNNKQYLSARRNASIGYVNDAYEWEKFITF